MGVSNQTNWGSEVCSIGGYRSGTVALEVLKNRVFAVIFYSIYTYFQFRQVQHNTLQVPYASDFASALRLGSVALVSILLRNDCSSSPGEASAFLFVQLLLVRSLARCLLAIGQTLGFFKPSTLSSPLQVLCGPVLDFACALRPHHRLCKCAVALPQTLQVR